MSGAHSESENIRFLLTGWWLFNPGIIKPSSILFSDAKKMEEYRICKCSSLGIQWSLRTPNPYSCETVVLWKHALILGYSLFQNTSLREPQTIFCLHDFLLRSLISIKLIYRLANLDLICSKTSFNKLFPFLIHKETCGMNI